MIYEQLVVEYFDNDRLLMEKNDKKVIVLRLHQDLMILLNLKNKFLYFNFKYLPCFV